MRCVWCPQLEEERFRGRVEGFWIAAIVTLIALLAAGYLFPEAFAWLVGRVG
jgi:hypothetical protein